MAAAGDEEPDEGKLDEEIVAGAAPKALVKPPGIPDEAGVVPNYEESGGASKAVFCEC
jgi:hypothetical protein